MGEYIRLGNLEVYKTSLKLSRQSWTIYQRLDWQTKKIIGDQFIRSVDLIGANVAEGYGRYHYLDRIKFYYNSRGSLLEAKHWLWLLKTRNFISRQEFDELIKDLNYFNYQLNKFISSTYQTKIDE